MEIDLNKLIGLKGLVATVSLTGTVMPQFSHSLSNLRDLNSRQGLLNIEYRYFEAKLVEAGRDAVCTHALKHEYDWILMIDADAGPFPENSLIRMLWTIYATHPFFDMLGVYAQLKAAPYLPVIDTGTGTWEPHMPNGGIMEVIRTGGHFFLLKTNILKRMSKPWFRSRVAYTPAKAFREIDNYARCKLDGKNPFTENPEWSTLVAQAAKDTKPNEESTVGEDSGFCDKVRALGGRIGVDTDIIAGHIGTKIIKPEDLKDAMTKVLHTQHARMGVLGYD